MNWHLRIVQLAMFLAAQFCYSQSFGNLSCSDLFASQNETESATTNFYKKGILYQPLSEYAKSLGLKYDRVEERSFALAFHHTRGGYSVGNVRRFISDKFAIDITGIEHRPGVSQEFIDHVNAHPKLPKIKDAKGRIVTKSEQLSADWSSQEIIKDARGTEDVSMNKEYDQYLLSLNYEQLNIVRNLRQKIYEDGTNQMNELILSYVRFAHTHYARRGWTPEMLQKLEKEAIAFAAQSTFITVREIDPVTKEVGAIVGNLRIIRAPYIKRILKSGTVEITSGSRLDYQLSDPITFVQSVHFRYDNQAQRDSPYDIGRHELNYDWKAESPKWRRAGFMRGHKLMMEETLGVELPRPARLTRTNIYAAFEGEGELLEAGAFAIDKRFNAPAFAEILTHLMLFVDDPNFSRDFNRNSRAFYTYNDYPQLYSGLGFVKIGDPYMTEHNEKTGKEHSWWILRALPEDLSAAIQRISTYRKNMDLENLEKIRNQILSSEP